MLKILINAYACSPNMGSEPGMAWNWCVHLAKHCELHIITEGEFRQTIESVVPTLPQAKNMHFYYNTVSDEIRTMCWNQGDWRFYKHYRAWQYKTYEMALSIMQTTNIDIVHQLNMIGFREPGYLWMIADKPFVWGPVGGLKQFPINYLVGAGLKMRLFIMLKNYINIFQLKYDIRVNKALKRANVLVSSIPDSYRAIKKYKAIDSITIPETGCYLSDYISTERFDNDEFHVLWVGKFDFRKQLLIAINAIAATGNKKIIFDVYGKGNIQQENEAQKHVIDLGLENQIIWHGNQSNEKIMIAMQSSQLFFFTSVSEDTSTVVLEAITNCLPVLCFDACGFGAVIDEKVGVKIPLSNPQQSVNHFAEKIEYLYNNRQVLKQMSENCTVRQHELSWDSKAEQMLALYEKAMEEVRSK